MKKLLLIVFLFNFTSLGIVYASDGFCQKTEKFVNLVKEHNKFSPNMLDFQVESSIDMDLLVFSVYGTNFNHFSEQFKSKMKAASEGEKVKIICSVIDQSEDLQNQLKKSTIGLLEIGRPSFQDNVSDAEVQIKNLDLEIDALMREKDVRLEQLRYLEL